MLDRVQAALDAIQREGSFAARLRCPAKDLAIEVKGVGVLRFPLSAATARKLSSVARPAPFGLRERTLHNPNIRDTGQIQRSSVKIDRRRWKPVLQAHLAQIQRSLGLPAEGALGLAPLYRHVEDSLTQSAAEPLRKKQQELLAWLTQEQTAFCDVAADDTQCEEVGRLP